MSFAIASSLNKCSSLEEEPIKWAKFIVLDVLLATTLFVTALLTRSTSVYLFSSFCVLGGAILGSMILAMMIEGVRACIEVNKTLNSN